MISRAAASRSRSYSQDCLHTSRFPVAKSSTIGSLLFDYLSRTRARKLRICGAGSTSVPFFMTPNRAVRLECRSRPRGSIARPLVARCDPPPSAVLRQLTERSVAPFPPAPDTSLIYAGECARIHPPTNVVVGIELRLGRRNGFSPNVRLADGSLLFSQPDFLDPYHIRNDLYVQRNGVETRLTRGARLSAPDVRADGEIVAVQNSPGTTRLVRVSRDARTIVPITGTSLDNNFDPRWSPDGSRIAAVMPRLLSKSDSRAEAPDVHLAQRAPINSRPTGHPTGGDRLSSGGVDLRRSSSDGLRSSDCLALLMPPPSLRA